MQQLHIKLQNINSRIEYLLNINYTIDNKKIYIVNNLCESRDLQIKLCMKRTVQLS